MIKHLKEIECTENLAKLTFILLDCLSINLYSKCCTNQDTSNTLQVNMDKATSKSFSKESTSPANKEIVRAIGNSFLGKVNGWKANVVENLANQLCTSSKFSILENHVINKIQKESCEICWNNFNEKESLTYLKKCGHSFCNRCLIHYLLLASRNSRKGAITCPVCIFNDNIVKLKQFLELISKRVVMKFQIKFKLSDFET